MFDRIGKSLFEALAQEAALRLGPAHPCHAALIAAAEGGAEAVPAAQAALAALRPEELATLMRGAHQRLREDPGALLARWPGPGRRPN